jgi:hypothetical protein
VAKFRTAADKATSEPPSQPAKNKPVHEVRIGKIKAVIWANQVEGGKVRHNFQLRRLFKRDAESSWEESDSFGRDDGFEVIEVTRLAILWIYQQGQG